MAGLSYPLAHSAREDVHTSSGRPVIEITLEFVMHLDTLIGALASRPGRGS